MVEDAPGRADDDVDPGAQPPELLAHRGAAVDGGHAGAGADPQRDELGSDLEGELAGGHEDEGANMVGRLREELGEGDAERGGLAGARPGCGDEVGTVR